MWTRLSYGGTNLPYNFSRFICDNKTDLSELPTNVKESKNGTSKCSIGSIAIVISERKEYMLDNKNTWKFVRNYEVSGGGAGTIPDIATIPEIQEYIK